MSAHAQFTSAGWASTRHNYRPAYRGPGGWVACRVPGEGLVLYRDTHDVCAYFATYRTPTELLADVQRAMRTDRTRREPEVQRERVVKYHAWDQSDRWAPDDPRWG